MFECIRGSYDDALYKSTYTLLYSATDAARITKLDTEMFHDESLKAIYFGVKRSKVNITSHKDIAGVGIRTLVSAGFF